MFVKGVKEGGEFRIVTIDKLRNPGVHRWGNSSSSPFSSSSSATVLERGGGMGGEGVEVDRSLGQKRRVGTAFAADVVVSNGLFGVCEVCLGGRVVVYFAFLLLFIYCFFFFRMEGLLFLVVIGIIVFN